MKFLVFFCAVLVVKAQDTLDHCTNDNENLFADTSLIPDSSLSAEAVAIRNGEEWSGSERLTLTIPFTDGSGGALLVKKIKLVANAQVDLAYTSPDKAEFVLVPIGHWSSRSEYIIRGKPVLMTSLRLTLGAFNNGGDTVYTASDLRIFGCELHVIDSVQEMAAEGEDSTGGDIDW